MGDNELFSLIIITIIIMVVMALSVLLIFNVSQKRIFKEIANNQEKEIQFQQKLLTSNIETQETERNKIARELHDEIGSKLNVINLNMNLLESAISRGEDTTEIIDQIHTSLKNSIERTREISHSLMPPVLMKFGIQSALNSLVTSINRTGELVISLDVVSSWGQLSKMEELHLYRIIQELINNTIKHSKAKNVELQTKVIDSKLTIVYKDDGIGIEADGFNEKKVGLGMHNINTRLKLLKAKKKINLQIEKGFEITITKTV